MFKYQLTNCWNNFRKCAILIKCFKFIDDLDFIISDELPITVRGQLLKSHNPVKVVGYTNKRVFSSAIRLDNGRGKAFSVLVVGFNKLADELYAESDGSEIGVSGQLLLAKQTCDYEIHLMSVEKGGDKL